MTDSRRKHKWDSGQKDADGDTYKTCRRKNCGIIWSPMHDRSEPVGCSGQD